MTTFAKILNGVVADIFVLPDGATPETSLPPQAAEGCVPCGNEVRRDWTYDGSSFSPPENQGGAGSAVPTSVTRAQAKIALHRAGLLDMVKTAVAADPEMQIWFDDALSWERQNPHIIALGEQLIGDAAGVDALFIAAAAIQA